MTSSPAIRIVRPSASRDTGKSNRLVTHSTVATPSAIHVQGSLPLTLSCADLARELKASTKTIQRMNDAGALPQPVTVGARSLRWVRQTIVEWLAAGCPDRATFEASAKRGERP